MIQHGTLVNARVGVQLHPQSPSVAGGMTYRPQGGVEQRPACLSHKQEVVGNPTPAPICPMPTKKGDECMGYPTNTGFCTGHNKTVGAALKELLGG